MAPGSRRGNGFATRWPGGACAWPRCTCPSPRPGRPARRRPWTRRWNTCGCCTTRAATSCAWRSTGRPIATRPLVVPALPRRPCSQTPPGRRWSRCCTTSPTPRAPSDTPRCSIRTQARSSRPQPTSNDSWPRPMLRASGSASMSATTSSGAETRWQRSGRSAIGCAMSTSRTSTPRCSRAPDAGRYAGLEDAVRDGLFTELGAGALDLDGVLASLIERDYDGWLMVEQDHGFGPPSESAAIGRRVLAATLRRLGDEPRSARDGRRPDEGRVARRRAHRPPARAAAARHPWHRRGHHRGCRRGPRRRGRCRDRDRRPPRPSPTRSRRPMRPSSPRPRRPMRSWSGPRSPPACRRSARSRWPATSTAPSPSPRTSSAAGSRSNSASSAASTPAIARHAGWSRVASSERCMPSGWPATTRPHRTRPTSPSRAACSATSPSTTSISFAG